MMEERQELETAIARLEAERETLGDAVIDAALVGLRRRLAELERTEKDAAPAEAAGERRVMTVLFCDVVSSTALAEQLDPEVWSGLMNDAFDLMAAPIDRYGGKVSRLLGDSVLALFGAPTAHEDDPQRAVLAGLDILRSFHPFRERVRREQGLEFNVRIGINTGLAVVGEVGGSAGHSEYSALGDAVNLAARMEQTARPGTVQIAQGTYSAVAPLFEVRPLGAIEVKGKRQPVAAYQVLGRKAEPGRLRGLTRHGISSPLVGRESEFASARAALARLLAGEGGILTILGEAGIGKSRLLAELRDSLGQPADDDTRQSPVTWLEGHTISYGQTISYWPFQQILRHYAAINEEGDEEAAWLKLESHIRSLFAAESAEILPYLASLLSLEASAEYAERVRFLDGEALGHQVYRAMLRFCRRLARRRPLVFVFEDLHWIDRSSAGLLEHLLPLVTQAPILFIALSRPESDTAAARLRQIALAQYSTRYTEINLSPLSAGDSNRLVHNLLEIDGLPAHVRQMMVAKADGNPFYLEEIVRDLIEAGAIIHEPATGRWRATPAAEQVTVPDTIQALIIARIDRLDEGLKRVVRRAAVIGRSFLYRVLKTVLEEDVSLERHVAELQSVELIREKQRLPELEYIFKHALAQEAAYDSILLQERRQLHRRVGASIEALFADRLDDFYGLLAYHYTAAEEWDRAQTYLMKAGDQAGRLAADAEALAYYRRAMATYARARGDAWDPVERARLERKIGEALSGLGEHQQARAYLARALALLGKPLPESRWRIRLALAGALLRQAGHRLLPRLFVRSLAGAPDPAAEEYFLNNVAIGWMEFVVDLERYLLININTLNASERAGYAYGAARFSASIGLVADSLGWFGLAESYFRRGERYAKQIDPYRPVFELEGARTIHHNFLGELDQSLEHGRRGAEIAQKAGDLRAWGSSMTVFTLDLYSQGKLAAAAAAGREMIDVAQEGSDRQVVAWGLWTAGCAQRRLGQLDEASASLSRAVELAEELPDYVTRVACGGWLGRCYRDKGELDQALSILEASLEIFHANGASLGGYAYLGNGLAEAYLSAAEQASGAEKQAWLQKAKRACRETLKVTRRVRPALPESLLFMGRYEWLNGRPAAAQKWWQQALEAAQEMGLRYDEALVALEIGERSGGRDHLRRAEAILAEIGGGLDLERARERASSKSASSSQASSR